MANNLTLSSATFSGSPLALTAGHGYTAGGFLPSAGPLTIRLRLHVTGDGSGDLYGAVHADSSLLIGVNYSNNLYANYNTSSGQINFSTSSPLADGEHYVELDLDGGGARLYCDTALVASNAGVFVGNSSTLWVRSRSGGGFEFPGSVRDVAVYNIARTAGSSCTVPSLLTGSEAGLIAAWPLTANGNDITGQAPPSASSYTLTGPSSGTAGTASSAFSATVSGTLAASTVITPSDGGVGGTFTPTTLTLAAGSSPSGTFVYTAAAAGTASISTTNNGGLTNPAPISFVAAAPPTTTVTRILARRSLNGRPQSVTTVVSGGGGGGSGSAPPALSGITWTQAMALDPAAADATVVGYLRPTGGIGPFVYSVTGNAGYGLVDATSGLVRVVYYAPNSQGTTFQATVTDGRGVTSAPTTVTVRVASSGPITTLNEPNPCTNCASDPVNNGPIFRLQQGSATISVLDRGTGLASTKWSEQYDYMRWAAGAPITAGTYPLTINYTGRPALAFDLVVQNYTPIAYIEFAPGTVSTSMLASSPVGRALATTPNNNPIWSLTDASGTFQINSATGAVSTAKQPASAGPITFSITVTDQIATYTKLITINVVAGTTLPAGNMTFSGMTTAFTNDTYNNAIGTPTVSGVNGTKSWSLVSQTGFNPVAVASGVPARYAIDQNSGAISAATILSGNLDGSSSTTDTLVISCTDGINTCTQSLPIVVSWATITKTIHAGRGKSTATGLSGTNPVGVETFAQARAQCMAPHTGTYHVLVYADASPDYYTNDNGTATTDYSLRFPWQGPILIEGVAGNGFSMPRMGGPASLNAPGGTDMRGKGFIVSGDGDMVAKNLEISGCHDAYSDGVHGVEAIRKDGAVAGNITLQHCYLHDNDNNFLSAFGHQQALIEYCFLDNGGTSHVSSGACHNAYLGEMSHVTVRYNFFRRETLGHDVKSRAQITEVYSNRIMDGLSGSASALIELPFAGQASVYSNILEKGCMAFGPDTIRYGAEGFPWAVNTLDVHSNTASVLTLAGSHYGTPSFVGFFYGANSNGVPATASVANNSLWLGPSVNKFNFYTNQAAANTTVTDTGTTMLSAPPTIDMTRPDLGTGNVPPASFFYRMQGQDDFTSIAGVQQIGDREQIHISASGTASGTTICNVRASNDLGSQSSAGGSVANPFGAGTTWAVSTTGTYYGNTPWATAGKYSVTANSDGTAALKAGTGLAVGVDYVQLLATGSGGATALYRYPIVVAA